MFPTGSSMGPPPARQCTNVAITNDNLLEDEFETIPLTAFSSDPVASFSPGGNSATISIQDNESGYLSTLVINVLLLSLVEGCHTAPSNLACHKIVLNEYVENRNNDVPVSMVLPQLTQQLMGESDID